MIRRQRGEGSVYRRKDGRWEARLRLPNGRQKSIYTRSRKLAERQLEDSTWRVECGLPLHGAKRTLGEYLEYWLEVTRRRIRPTTFESYELCVRRLLPMLGSLRLSHLGPAAVQAAYDGLLQGGLSARSVEQTHSVLHRALYQALHWGLIATNPAELVAPPRPIRREMTALTAHQLQRLLATTRGQRWHALWVLLGTTGLRIGEARALSWDCVDLNAKRLVVVRSLQRQQATGLVFAEPKTLRSRRLVHLSGLACDTLREHRAQQAPSSDLVFANRNGEPQDSGSVTTALHRALRRADLPQVRVHDLRHTVASVLLAHGANPKVVQDLLGHSTVLTTLNTYSHLTESMSHLAAETMDRVIGDQQLWVG
jgi:integrase